MDPLLAVVVIALGSMVLTLGVLWLVLHMPPASPLPPEAEPDEGWRMVECRVCGYADSRWQAPGSEPDLECPRCGCMACDPIAAD